MNNSNSNSNSNIIILESPFSGDIDKNVAYTQRCMAHAREQKDIVIVPHLMWTQHHLKKKHFSSDYDKKYEITNGGREVSLQQIEVLRRIAGKVVFYIDYGYSNGMLHGLEQCKKEQIQWEERKLGNLEQDTINAEARK